jgi:hypothetical protein
MEGAKDFRGNAVVGKGVIGGGGMSLALLRWRLRIRGA